MQIECSSSGSSLRGQSQRHDSMLWIVKVQECLNVWLRKLYKGKNNVKGTSDCGCCTYVQFASFFCLVWTFLSGHFWNSLKYVHSLARRCVKAHTHTHTYTYTHTNTHTHKHTQTHKHKNTHKHTHKHTHTYTHKHTHKHIHTQTQTCTYLYDDDVRINVEDVQRSPAQA
jgi:hypothetical protein